GGHLHAPVHAQGLVRPGAGVPAELPRDRGPAHQHREHPRGAAHRTHRDQAELRGPLRRVDGERLPDHRPTVHLRRAGHAVTRAALALLAIATAAACGDGAPAGAHTAIDSAGVRVVTSTAPSWGPDAGWRVDTVPELEVGSGARAGDPLLIGVEAVRRLADGQLLVATTDDQVLRWIDRDGAVVRTAGGAGEGPGEYRGLSVLGFIGDSLLTWDGRLGRVTVVAPDGAPARQFRLGDPDSANATRYGFAPSAVLDGEIGRAHV